MTWEATGERRFSYKNVKIFYPNSHSVSICPKVGIRFFISEHWDKKDTHKKYKETRAHTHTYTVPSLEKRISWNGSKIPLFFHKKGNFHTQN